MHHLFGFEYRIALLKYANLLQNNNTQCKYTKLIKQKKVVQTKIISRLNSWELDELI